MASEPRPAACVILARRGGKHAQRALEVCMVRRNPASRFMPGVWVFPGGTVQASDGDPAVDDGEAAHRACAVRELREEAGIDLEADQLVPYSRWITPEIVDTRFDTRFYLALAPPHSPPRPDGEEATEAGWFAPAAALDRHHAGQMPLVFPTIKHLESLLPFSTAERALEAARKRKVEPVLPRVVGEGKERRIALPGEPGYQGG